MPGSGARRASRGAIATSPDFNPCGRWTNARGRRLGRPPIPEALEERIREARKGGLSVRKAAAKFGVSPGTVQRIPFAHVAGASAAAS